MSQLPDVDEPLLVTSALPYANGPLHLGHLAGVYLPADIFVRYQRLNRRDVLHVCGSDEHGVPIMLRARNEGIPPQAIVDRYHKQISQAFADLGISFDHYGRTSDDIHRETSQSFFNTMAESSAFRIETRKQLFDAEAGLFLADRLVRGTCPHCNYEDAYGDQCESCGQTLSPQELLNPRSAVTDSVPQERTTAHWYLPLGESQAWLEEWISSKSHWKSNVLGQVKSWLQDGLADRAMTRDLPWGVPVPNEAADAADIDPEGKVLYVWFDAPIGYISITRDWAEKRGTPDEWKRYWKGEKSRLVHFLGKDNIVFHCIIFPTMLKLHGDFVLPDNVPANEFLNLKGLKFSTSRGVAVWLHEFLEKYPPDYLRYAATKVLPERSDSDFSWEGLQASINNELADTLGNFVNRSFTFAVKHFDGKVPPLVDPSPLDSDTLDALRTFPERIAQHLEHYRFREALDETMSLARMGNKYFNDSQPWATRKTNLEQCGNTIHVSLQICASLAVLFDPFIPFSAQNLRSMLCLDDVRSSLPDGQDGSIDWAGAGRALLTAGHVLGQARILFNKIPDTVVEEEMAILKGRSEPDNVDGPTYEALKDTIVYDDFSKIDLRAGKILSAEKLPKSKKLILTQVDLGFETRQILAGVAEYLSPEELVGRTFVVVANLAPRKMMGHESQGMLLMAENRDGVLLPVETTGEPGSTVA